MSNLEIPASTHGVRFPATFSQTMQPTRVMVVNWHGEPLGVGHCLARHLLMGKLTGYLVALEDGSRLTVAPSQLRSPENVVMPPIHSWALNRMAKSTSPQPFPPGAA